MIEVQVKEREAADELIVRAPGYAPFQDYTAIQVFLDFGYEIDGSLTICQGRRAPITHDFRVGVDRIECVRIRLGNRTKTDSVCVDRGKVIPVHVAWLRAGASPPS